MFKIRQVSISCDRKKKKSNKIKIYFPEKISQNWLINKNNIIESKFNCFEDRIFKFSFNPPSGELIFVTAPTHHDAMIHAFGKYQFNEYVRGIHFKEKKIIYLRDHENKSWLRLTKKMLRQYGVPKEMRIIWGKKAAEELKEDLRGL